jgi:hypothetical protein
MNKLSDVSGCIDTTCIRRNKCLRYSGIPDAYWQSYTNFGSMCKAPDFEQFIEMEDEY